ncbi:GNAT family N-acetyltransferase [Spirulina major]|uniref:GNAT family N-acetyltransferase n=1 Tax=Spirulina major TaxID=270636 RepID=UPI0009333F9A|nr:GNAT family N-acetyltransferase [Spirulina major]
MLQTYKTFVIRDWQERDRTAAAHLIRDVLREYGLPWEPEQADRDVIEVETHYSDQGGEFWVIEQDETLVGTGAYYPIERGENAVEIRKMYLHPTVRGQGLGRFLLTALETAVQQQGFHEIWIETATSLAEAVQLYERHGYQKATGVETARCDLVYRKLLPQHTLMD